MKEDILSKVRFDAVPAEAILSPKQLKYYTAYFRDNKSMADISIMYDVDTSTVCRVLKNARKAILDYYSKGGADVRKDDTYHCNKVLEW